MPTMDQSILARSTPRAATRVVLALGSAIAMTLATAAARAEDKPAEKPAASTTYDPTVHPHGARNVRDPYIKGWLDITYDRIPPEPDPSHYGMDAKTGDFKFPIATPDQTAPKPFKGQLTYWDPKSYAKNVEVVQFYPQILTPWHTWQTIADFDGKRYMYVYDRFNLQIWDISDPRKAKLLLHKGEIWSKSGPGPAKIPFRPGERFGATSIQWNKTLGKYILVQSQEVQRFGLLHDKLLEPDLVDKIRHGKHLKGFKVYAMNGPMPEDWELLAERTTDIEHPNAPEGQQEGSGSLDVPVYYGDKYMFLAAAPSDKYALTEYPNYLYSPGYQSWDMSDPRNPKFLNQLTVPGQILGDKAHEDAYLINTRSGNRTSWMGARMPLFIPTPVEKGGKYGFAAMGGLGFYVVDISDPAHMKTISHLEFPPSVGGTEGDNIDVSQYERTGMIFYSGYPMNEDCWEPYKDIYVIDVKDPQKPKIVTTFPRPTPPKDAAFTHFCQRRGSFGPKRTGYYTQPGKWRDGISIYAFYNAGIQIFDVKDPAKPTIAGYYVPNYDVNAVPDYAQGNSTYGTYIEYDRNIIWAFTSHGMYALSTPLLGKPVYGVPRKSWPPKE